MWKYIFLFFYSLSLMLNSTSANDPKEQPIDQVQRPPIVFTSGKINDDTLDPIKAKPGQFPHLVSLRLKSNDRHLCFGSILTNKLIITLARCLHDDIGHLIETSDIKVVAGEIIHTPAANAKQKSDVHNFIFRKKIADPKSNDELALMTIKEPFKFNEFVNMIRPQVKVENFTENCQIPGWHQEHQLSGTSDTTNNNDAQKPWKIKSEAINTHTKLYYVDTKRMNLKQCIDFRIQIPPKEICTRPRHLENNFDSVSVGSSVICKGHLAGVVFENYKTKNQQVDVIIKFLSFSGWVAKHQADGAGSKIIPSSFSILVCSISTLFMY